MTLNLQIKTFNSHKSIFDIGMTFSFFFFTFLLLDFSSFTVFIRITSIIDQVISYINTPLYLDDARVPKEKKKLSVLLN